MYTKLKQYFQSVDKTHLQNLLHFHEMMLYDEKTCFLLLLHVIPRGITVNVLFTVSVCTISRLKISRLSHLVSLRREPHGGNLGLTCVHSAARPAVWSSFPENYAYYNESKETTVLTLARL